MNYVEVPDFVPSSEVERNGNLAIGRFCWKTAVPSLLQQVFTAFHQDMGISTDFIPFEIPHPQSEEASRMDPAPDPEVDAAKVQDLLTFLSVLAPLERAGITADVRSGESHYKAIGYASCHTPTLRIGLHAISALSEVDAPLYSDLLIHDMGQVPLADNRPDGLASGRDWRTAPLWGLSTNLDRPGTMFLHSGTAADLPSAIRAHGGETRQSRIGFEALSPAEKKAN